MASEIDLIVDQLRRGFDGEAWHGRSLKTILTGVTAQQAARRRVAGAHTIWELVLHITGWKREVAQRLRGKAAGDPESGDWPVRARTTSAAWRAARADLARAQQELIAAVQDLPPRRLHKPVKDFRNDAHGAGMTAYQTIYGIIQHDAYHAGQIAMLKAKRVGPLLHGDGRRGSDQRRAASRGGL